MADLLYNTSGLNIDVISGSNYHGINCVCSSPSTGSRGLKLYPILSMATTVKLNSEVMIELFHPAFSLRWCKPGTVHRLPLTRRMTIDWSWCYHWGIQSLFSISITGISFLLSYQTLCLSYNPLTPALVAQSLKKYIWFSKTFLLLQAILCAQYWNWVTHGLPRNCISFTTLSS